MSILREFFALHVFKLWKASFVLFHIKLCRQCQCLSLTHTQEKWSQSNKLWHLSSNITQAPSLQHKNSHKIIPLVLFYTYVYIYISFLLDPSHQKSYCTVELAQAWELSDEKYGWQWSSFMHAYIMIRSHCSHKEMTSPNISISFTLMPITYDKVMTKI